MKKNYNFKKAIRRNLLICFALLLSIYNVNSQNLNFTIDTAVDTGTTITETITDGSDTYVLTIDHLQNVEELDDLGGGDLIFYLGSGNGPTPFLLSITKNGNLTNFGLNSIDYDTLGIGNISIANQDDEIISASTSYPIGFGALVMTNLENALNITQIKIIPGNGTDLNNFGFHNINVDILASLSMKNLIINDALVIFPNPSNGNITIKNSGIALDKVAVSDINGRAVANFNLNGITANKALDLQLTSGLYFISITSKNTTIVRKIIIK